MKNIIIVESPTKAKTLKKYLDSNYEIIASMGHIKDLPKKDLGIDIENEFKPTYRYLPGKKKIVDAIKKASINADNIYLASDPDREGEAIAWHLYEELYKNKNNVYRVLFNEITKEGILKGLENPGKLDLRKIDSQKSRRILDRLVGYLISPLLWKPLKYGLSAGRVQTSALRLICEREKEIEDFKPKEYWSITAKLLKDDFLFDAKLVKVNGKKANIKNKAEAEKIKKELKKEQFIIDSLKEKISKKNPPNPLITSTLQQEAYKRFGFSAKKTMLFAQRLYEGIEIGSEGPVGLITYMRTDSTRISPVAIKKATNFIENTFGSNYVGTYKQKKNKKSNIQDAHEAIRPTYIEKTPDKLKKYLDNDHHKLYTLIWETFIASQMKEAQYKTIEINIKAKNYTFITSARKCIFDGFEKLTGTEKENKTFLQIENLQKGVALVLKDIEAKQHFTQPPARYTYATLIKELEDKGIGRPSTYANIVSTIIERNYVEIKKKYFYPTELGRLVNHILTINFPNIFDINFTARMENFLDEIEEGKYNWKEIIENFYKGFNQELENANKNFIKNLVVDKKCPKCGESLTFKYGKKGLFIACSNYPNCTYTSDFKRDESGNIELYEKKDDLSGIFCEKCGAEFVIKKSRGGEFLACSNYPECKNIKNFIRNEENEIIIINQNEPLDYKCPQCGGGLIVKSGKNGMFVACSNYPNCKFTTQIEVNNNKIVPKILEIDDITCDKCGSKMIVKRSKRGTFFACSKYPECKNTKSAIIVDNTITTKENAKTTK
ncbi:MAG: type I DNA topoisomerase [Deferribacterota bacterium]|nr:type I DNA topoisomerase [Deferribacterota bacterium]